MLIPDGYEPDKGDTNARKGLLRSIIVAVEVDDKAVRIIGSKDAVQAVIAGEQTANGNVHDFIRKWLATQNKTTNSYAIEITI